MNLMNRLKTFALLLFVPLGFLSGQAVGKPSAFVDTDPMGARISLDGTLLDVRTPALLRGVAPGKHHLSLWHEGFQQADVPLEVVEGKVPSVSVPLISQSTVLAFPANTTVSDAGGIHQTTGDQFQYPNGRYDVMNGETLTVKPVFPDEGLLAVAGWSLLFLSSAAVVSTASDVYHVNTGWMDHPSEVTLGLALSVFFELPWYGSLLARKARFDRENAPTITPVSEHLDLATEVFEKGDAALQSGDLPKAEKLFTQLVKEFPESRLVPGAWFRLARIHLVSGRRELATGEYRLVADTYPQADYYDRARQALADLYEAAGDKPRALENLDSMLLVDGFFDPADVAAQKARLQAPVEAPHAP